ncbi:MAG: tRNA pseudouridine(55) synthase TruB [Armatimonadetes bacterium 55-13]|nr:tRNA pseudouridine(55) synthase TruB [Armatimonadota bacterium]ODU53649.1 MAG: tRNA pseudouridine(55) synthase TruB [bacterium SCN 57-13]OJU62277.1 MAG: tRNA pseudouridine(55) synthase TruB [Armatimonadetes bacterium 55-13]
MLGIILINKEKGCTSHDVVNAVRRKFSTRRVGHAGTLDPLATGLLVVAVGPATRFLQYLPLEPKEYVAQIKFGKATSTFDEEGEVTSEGPVPDDLSGAIQEVMPQFLGLISQLPPMYSAVKIDGKPLYHYARQGKTLEREPRRVHIEQFEITQMSQDSVEARILCSGGTYIRSLAHDLGEAIGAGAHLTGLHRSRVGRFTDGQATALTDATPDMLISLREALPPMPLIQLDETQVHQIREGRQIGLESPTGSRLVALLEPGGNVFSVARVLDHMVQPECVIPAEATHGVS